MSSFASIHVTPRTSFKKNRGGIGFAPPPPPGGRGLRMENAAHQRKLPNLKICRSTAFCPKTLCRLLKICYRLWLNVPDDASAAQESVLPPSECIISPFKQMMPLLEGMIQSFKNTAFQKRVTVPLSEVIILPSEICCRPPVNTASSYHAVLRCTSRFAKYF